MINIQMAGLYKDGWQPDDVNLPAVDTIWIRSLLSSDREEVSAVNHDIFSNLKTLIKTKFTWNVKSRIHISLIRIT